MPALGMAQDSGKVVRWLKSEGEQVTKGDPIVEIETDKATVEVEAPASGTLAGVSVTEGDEVPVGTQIGIILAPGESMPEPAATPVPVTSGRPAGSPKAKRLAAERGIDISKIHGSGPGGAILEEDVLHAAAGGRPSETAQPPLWRAMAENVTHSWRVAPHFFLTREIDASALVAERSRQGGEVTFSDLIIKAVARALSRHPRMNGMGSEINIGLAVALTDGLIVPVLHGVDGLATSEIAARRVEVLERVRAGKLHAANLSGGTFTVSNLGMYGVDQFTAILTDGQAGILAVGRIADRVMAHQGAATVRPAMLVTLSCDHRQIDGARAAEFMQTLVELLETAPD